MQFVGNVGLAEGRFTQVLVGEVEEGRAAACGSFKLKWQMHKNGKEWHKRICKEVA